MTYDFTPQNFLRKDIAFDGQRHLIFASEDQLQVLSTAKTLYTDGTFKFARLSHNYCPYMLL